MTDPTGSEHVLLTGGTGFFGLALLRHWDAIEAAHGDLPRVTVLTRSPGAFLDRHPQFAGREWLSFLKGDVCDANSLPHDRAFTHILHAAADSTLGPELTPLQRHDQIVFGTRNMLELAVATGTRRFLLASSGAVYGPQPDHLERIPEDWNGMPDPLEPSSAYGVGKREAEHLCALYREAHGLETVIARCFAFVGRDLPLDVHFAIGNFIQDALWREEITVQGDGSPMRSYLDQRDLAEWLLAILRKGRPGRAYNVGSDQSISIADLARLVGEIASPGKPVRILGASQQGQPRSRYVPSIERALEELGLEVRFPLAAAIKAAADAHRGPAAGTP